MMESTFPCDNKKTNEWTISAQKRPSTNISPLLFKEQSSQKGGLLHRHKTPMFINDIFIFVLSFVPSQPVRKGVLPGCFFHVCKISVAFPLSGATLAKKEFPLGVSVSRLHGRSFAKKTKNSSFRTQWVKSENRRVCWRRLMAMSSSLRMTRISLSLIPFPNIVM